MERCCREKSAASPQAAGFYFILHLARVCSTIQEKGSTSIPKCRVILDYITMK